MTNWAEFKKHAKEGAENRKEAAYTSSGTAFANENVDVDTNVDNDND